MESSCAAGNAAITTDGSTPSLASGITGAEVRTLIGAGESAARTAVYANIAALPTSGTAGDMAYVTATNRLYIWTGTGWYNIALINNNPTISGVSATYDLATDGTATTVTITATDPEGLPITYSIVSDTSGNAATVHKVQVQIQMYLRLLLQQIQPTQELSRSLSELQMV